MKGFFSLIMKNFHVILSGKLSFFLLIFGPLIFVSLISVSFDDSKTHLFNLGVSESSSELSKEYISSLEKNGFTIREFNSKEECISELYDGTLHGCVSFPSDFKIEDGKTQEIEVVVDNTQSNIVYLLENVLTSSLVSNTEQIKFSYLEDISQNLIAAEVYFQDSIQLINEIDSLSDSIESLEEDLNEQISKLKSTNTTNAEILDDYSEVIEDLKEGFKNLSSEIVKTFDVTEEIIGNISDSLDNTNLSSSQKADIEDQLDDLESELFTIEAQVRALDKVDEIEDLEDEFVVLKNSLTSFSRKLNSLSNGVSGKINEQQSKIDELLNQTKDISSDFTSLSLKNPQTLLNPVKLSTAPAFEDTTNNPLSSMFPVFLFFLVCVIALLLGSQLSFNERVGKAYTRIMMAKVSSNTILLANIFSLLILLFIQIGLLGSIYYIVFVKEVSLLIELLMVLPLVLFVFISLGLLLGYISKSRSTNLFLVFFVLMLLFSFSGSLLPIELLPSQIIYYLELYNPVLLSQALFRKILLFSLGIEGVKDELVILAVEGLLIYVILLMVESYSRKSSFFQFFFPRGTKKIKLKTHKKGKKSKRSKRKVSRSPEENYDDITSKILDELDKNKNIKK